VVIKIATAIRLHGANRTILRNVWIRGFNKGIEAVNSNLLLSGVNVQRCGTGLGLVNSYASVHRSSFLDNAIDIVVDKSTAFIINTIAYRILEILPKGDYRINPYTTGRIAHEIIRTRDLKAKRSLLRKLLNSLKYVRDGWIVYQILKEIRRVFP
jgi:hypothetical protein